MSQNHRNENFKIDLEAAEDKDWQLNFAPAIRKMERVCASWKFRNLSLKRWTVVLNTLVLPIIYYQSAMLPVPTKVFKEVDRVIASFMWRGKKAQSSKQCLEMPTHSGGLRLHCFASRVRLLRSHGSRN